MLVQGKETFYIDLICSNNQQTRVLLMASEIYAAFFLDCSLMALRAATNNLISYYGKGGYERYVDACVGRIGYNYRNYEKRNKIYKWRRPEKETVQVSSDPPSRRRTLRGIEKKTKRYKVMRVHDALERKWDTVEEGWRLYWMTKCIEGLKEGNIEKRKIIAGSRYDRVEKRSWPGFDNVFQMVQEAVDYQSGYNDPAFDTVDKIQLQGHLGMCRHGMQKERINDDHYRCTGNPDHVWNSSRAKMMIF